MNRWHLCALLAAGLALPAAPAHSNSAPGAEPGPALGRDPARSNQSPAPASDQAKKPPAAAEPKPALDAMEAAVAADPDDLRHASEYRQAVIRAGAYDRAIAFFERLVGERPQSANAWLNFGYAYVDKIPAAGSISQVILANNALTRFSKSIELKKSWLALYTRGNSYLYWPKIFGRAPLGLADLEEAMALAKSLPPKKIYARNYVALGDAYWKIDQQAKARATWKEGDQLFPGEPQLKARLARQGDAEALEAYISDQLDPNKRVDTDLRPLWEGP